MFSERGRAGGDREEGVREWKRGGNKFVTMSLPDCRHAQASSVLTCGGENTEKGRGGGWKKGKTRKKRQPRKREINAYSTDKQKPLSHFFSLAHARSCPPSSGFFLLVLADSTSPPSPLKDGGGRVSFSAAAAATLPASPAAVESGEGGREGA